MIKAEVQCEEAVKHVRFNLCDKSICNSNITNYALLKYESLIAVVGEHVSRSKSKVVYDEEAW